HVFQTLASVLPNPLQLPIALRAMPFLFREVMDHSSPLQRLRDSLPTMSLVCWRNAFSFFGSRRLRLGQGLTTGANQGYGEQEQLILIHPLALRAVTPA